MKLYEFILWFQEELDADPTLADCEVFMYDPEEDTWTDQLGFVFNEDVLEIFGDNSFNESEILH